MAKKKKNPNSRYAGGKQPTRQAVKHAQVKDRKEQEKRAENAQKNTRMGNTFLVTLLAIIGVFCLYTLIRILFFSAPSLSELRSDLLFISVITIPYLLLASAFLIRKMMQKRRAEYSDRRRKLSGLLFVLVIVGAIALFGVQLYAGRKNAAELPAYTESLAALESTGQTVIQPEEVLGFRSLLEYALQTDFICGRTAVRLHYHADSAEWIAKRFETQAARDYEAFPKTEIEVDRSHTVSVWGPAEADGTIRAAVAARVGGEIRIVELSGPRDEVERIIPPLVDAAAAMQK